MKKISIITVVLNAAGTIERTIKSVLSQSYKNVEYIIIDGGSTDGTLNVIEKYRNSLAYFISEPDNGIYDAMNKGIRKATGDIIGLLNADDWYEKGALQTIALEFEQSDAHVIGGKTWMVDKLGNRRLHITKPFSELCMGMPVVHQAVFISKKAYETYGLYNTQYRITADHELLLRMYHGGAKFSTIDTILVNYSTTGVSATSSFRSAREHNLAVQKYLSFYKGRETEILESCKERLKNAYFHYYLENSFDSESIVLNSIGITCQTKNIIWGTGAWGRRIAEMFDRLGIPIAFFIDSDPKKQGGGFLGRRVSDSIMLRDFDGTVFIAVKKHDTEIADIIAGMNNPKVKCTLLRDFIDAAIRHENLQDETVAES